MGLYVCLLQCSSFQIDPIYSAVSSYAAGVLVHISLNTPHRESRLQCSYRFNEEFIYWNSVSVVIRCWGEKVFHDLGIDNRLCGLFAHLQ